MEPTKSPVSSQVIEMVADSKDVDPTDLPALYDCIDPDALDDLFTPNQNTPTNRHSIQVQFCYAGRNVLVRSADDIVIWPEDTEGPLIPSN